MEMKPKLEILKRTIRLKEWSECVRVVRRADRRMMMKLGEARQVFKLRQEDGGGDQTGESV